MQIGIDLGTTFCCVAYIGDDGVPVVINNSDHERTTPSVVWFDGRNAYVGKSANERKSVTPTSPPIFEFVKRKMGCPAFIKPELYNEGDPDVPMPAPYEVGGFKYGPEGMSAIILRKLKRDAIRHFKKQQKIDKNTEERDIRLDAVITVPAYFGDRERQKTRLAGIIAGLNVTGIINEPTAAALSYGLNAKEGMKVMVFDLGGGTFDVTILEYSGGRFEVITSDGSNTLGGKDWDVIIQSHLYSEFRAITGVEIPDDKGFDVQKLALQAKYDLTDSMETTVPLCLDGHDVDIRLLRCSRKADGAEMFDLDMNKDRTFYFDERSSDLLTCCENICERALRKASEELRKKAEERGEPIIRALDWRDIDEILLAGGSSRMPMVQDMLEKLTGRKVHKLTQLDFDTAIATGAAIFGKQRGCVRDVVSHSIGVKYVQNDRHRIDHVIPKDTRLPATQSRNYIGGPDTVLEVYEGESTVPDECVCRGRIPLDGIDGKVTVIMKLDENNALKVIADYPPNREERTFQEDDIDDDRLKELCQRVQAISINN